jgi:hypothetical protein
MNASEASPNAAAPRVSVTPPTRSPCQQKCPAARLFARIAKEQSSFDVPIMILSAREESVRARESREPQLISKNWEPARARDLRRELERG